MPEVIVFPDVEWLLCDYLRAELPNYGKTLAVDTYIPRPRPDEFVRLMRVGGSAELTIERPRVAVEYWATAEGAAHDGLQVTLGLIFAIDELGGHQFYMRPDERPAVINLPDPESSHIRYTANVDVPVAGYAV